MFYLSENLWMERPHTHPTVRGVLEALARFNSHLSKELLYPIVCLGTLSERLLRHSLWFVSTCGTTEPLLG